MKLVDWLIAAFAAICWCTFTDVVCEQMNSKYGSLVVIGFSCILAFWKFLKYEEAYD